MDVKSLFNGIMARIGYLPCEKPVLTGMADSLEAQAAAVRNAVRGKVSQRDRELLRTAEETLTELARMRNKILSGVQQTHPDNGCADTDAISDTFCNDLIRLLDLPSGE